MPTFGGSFGGEFAGSGGGASVVGSPTWEALFLGAPRSVVHLATLEIRHPAFSRVYRITPHHAKGFSATLEDGSAADFEYVPAGITDLGARDDLDAGVKVELGDLGAVIPEELDRIAEEDRWADALEVVYRVFRSDDLTAPAYGPVRLEVDRPVLSRQGCAFEARAPSLNVTQTGERYSVARFPGLRGLM